MQEDTRHVEMPIRLLPTTLHIGHRFVVHTVCT